ncbi:MAG: hypothetical protein LUG61_08905 [Lachnospiraceae bacterium]|nr:hypothetical protein [Lachnospiraceae bacterium]
MSKAVLVLPEMPKRCADCELCDQISPMADEGETEYFCNVKYNGEQVKTKIAEKKRASFCPLQPMPERKTPNWCSTHDIGYAQGWNDCIKAIEGSVE